MRRTCGRHWLLLLLLAAAQGQEVPEKAGINSLSEAERAARLARRQQQAAGPAAPGASPAVPSTGPTAPTTPADAAAAAAAAAENTATPQSSSAAAGAAPAPTPVPTDPAPIVPPVVPPSAPTPAAAAATPAATPPTGSAAAVAAARPVPEAGPAAAPTGPAAAPRVVPPADPAAAAAAAGVSPFPSPRPRRRRRRSPSPAPGLNASPSPAVAAPGAELPPGAVNATAAAAAALAAAAGNASDPAVVLGSSPGAADSVNATRSVGPDANLTDAGNGTEAGSSPAPDAGAPAASGSAAPSPGLEVPPARNNSNAGAIIGGILGTLAALTLLAGIACLIALCRRRRLRKSKNNPFSDDNIKKQQRPGPPQGPQYRPAWLTKLAGSGKNHPPAPAYAPRGPPGPTHGPTGLRVPGPNANGSQSYHRSASGGSGGHFYGVPPQGPPAPGSFSSSRSPLPPAAYGPPSAVVGGRGGGAYGFGADELQDGLQDLKYIVSDRLLSAVDNASLISDPVAAWIDAGMAEVRPEISNVAYGASHTFIEDWRTHRVWDWLNSSHWKFIPTTERLLDAQVMRNMPQQDFARQMLSEIKHDPRFPPFVTAVDDAVDALLEDAVDVARTVGVLSSSTHDSSSYRKRDQGGIPPAAQPAANYYRPVLTQLFEAVLKFHLQVQGTNSTAYVFVPGAPPAVSLAIPERGLVRKDRLGGTVAELHYLCECPGVFSEDPRATAGVEVWVPACAIRVGLRPTR